MRRRCFYWMVMIACCVWVAPVVQAQKSDPDRQRREQEIRRAITNLLDGCTGVVRVYPDAIDDPKHFETIRVSMTVRSVEQHRRRGRGIRRILTISHERIRAACPTISPGAYVVFFGADQTDEAVRTVLAECVYVTSYRENSLWTINLRLEDPARQPWWTFADALGDPIAGATVEIRYPIDSPGDSLCLGEVMLDDQGRPKPLRSVEPLIFQLSHPDYGCARVRHQRTRTGELHGVVFVPLIPLDSEKIASSIQGTVLDSAGNPVPGVTVQCSELRSADGQRLNRYLRYGRDAVTDGQGWFSLCAPLATEDGASAGLPPTGSRYRLKIQPPRRLNLRQLGDPTPLSVLVGTRKTYTLTPMETKKNFHTFAFEYFEGPVTDPDELNNMTLTLMRDSRLWARLTYEQFKTGCHLPPGTLYAATKRWGQSFSFKETELLPDSPEHIVIRNQEPVLYRGQVINGMTSGPAADVFVLADHTLAQTDVDSFTREQWQQLRQQANDDSLETLYQMRERVTVTDANGCYELVFLPGLDRTLNTFFVNASGHPPVNAQATYLYPGADGFTEVPTMVLSPSARASYMPAFVFESNAGPVTDPNELAEIRINIRNGTTVRSISDLSAYLERGEFFPGIYFAEAVWDRRLYIFEPVDLTEIRPEVAVFKPQEIRHANVIYQGRVIHGITGQPMPKALVIRSPSPTRDASGLEPGHWTSIKSLGPDLDPSDPALEPLWAKLSGRPDKRTGPCTLTDDNGEFRILLEHPAMRSLDSLLILDEHFLGVSQQLQLHVDFAKNPHRPRSYEPLVPDENGIVTVGPLKLFPAATLIIHPVVPDAGGRRRRKPCTLITSVSDHARPAWVSEAFVSSKNNFGAGVYRQRSLQPNVSQTVYVLAGADQRLTLFQPSDSPPPLVRLDQVRLEQGQTVDLGRIEIDTGVEVLVRVVDSRGNPVEGMRVVCTDQDGFGRRMRIPTDVKGLVSVKVAAHSTGRLCIFHRDRQTQERFEECIPYAIGGDEDAGREFTLQLPDEMLDRLRAERR